MIVPSKLVEPLTVMSALEFTGVSSSTLRDRDGVRKLKPQRNPMNPYRLDHRSELKAVLRGAVHAGQNHG